MLKQIGLGLALTLAACGSATDVNNDATADDAWSKVGTKPDADIDVDAGSVSTEAPAVEKKSNPDIKLLETGKTSVFCVDFNGQGVYAQENVQDYSITPNVSTFTLAPVKGKDDPESQPQEIQKGVTCTAITKFYDEKDAAKIDAYRQTEKLYVHATNGSNVILLKGLFSVVNSDDETNTMTITLTDDEGNALEKIVTAAPSVISTLNDKRSFTPE